MHMHKVQLDMHRMLVQDIIETRTQSRDTDGGTRQWRGQESGAEVGDRCSCRIRSVVSSRPFGQVSYSQSIRKQLDNIDCCCCCCCCCDLLLLMCLAVSLDLIIARPLIRTHLALKQTHCEWGERERGWQTEIAGISIKTPKPT